MEALITAPTLYAHWGWWLLGLLLLLAFCDDDDDREFCYSFGPEERCFKKPLPDNAYCYLMESGAVECFSKPLE